LRILEVARRKGGTGEDRRLKGGRLENHLLRAHRISVRRQVEDDSLSAGHDGG
jgi:hypothetical protein